MKVNRKIDNIAVISFRGCFHKNVHKTLFSFVYKMSALLNFPLDLVHVGIF